MQGFFLAHYYRNSKDVQQRPKSPGCALEPTVYHKKNSWKPAFRTGMSVDSQINSEKIVRIPHYLPRDHRISSLDLCTLRLAIVLKEFASCCWGHRMEAAGRLCLLESSMCSRQRGFGLSHFPRNFLAWVQ